MSSARLFVALELPAAERAALARWGRAAAAGDPALRVVAEAGLHVTLHFLGERPETDIPALRGAVEAAPPDAVRLVSAGVLWLSPRRPHVLTLGLADADPLTALHAGLGPALAAATPGWQADARRLRPHVTVARVRRGARPRTADVPDPPAVSCAAAAVVLLRSHLRPAGARYEALERRPLHSPA